MYKQIKVVALIFCFFIFSTSVLLFANDTRTYNGIIYNVIDYGTYQFNFADKRLQIGQRFVVEISGGEIVGNRFYSEETYTRMQWGAFGGGTFIDDSFRIRNISDVSLNYSSDQVQYLEVYFSILADNNGHPEPVLDRLVEIRDPCWVQYDIDLAKNYREITSEFGILRHLILENVASYNNRVHSIGVRIGHRFVVDAVISTISEWGFFEIEGGGQTLRFTSRNLQGIEVGNRIRVYFLFSASRTIGLERIELLQ